MDRYSHAVMYSLALTAQTEQDDTLGSRLRWIFVSHGKSSSNQPFKSGSRALSDEDLEVCGRAGDCITGWSRTACTE